MACRWAGGGEEKESSKGKDREDFKHFEIPRMITMFFIWDANYVSKVFVKTSCLNADI